MHQFSLTYPNTYMNFENQAENHDAAHILVVLGVERRRLKGTHRRCSNSCGNAGTVVSRLVSLSCECRF